MTTTLGTYRIDYFYQLHHRRLRERYRMTTIVRHEDRITDALQKRHSLVLTEGKVR